jgi:penicillin-binding protein 1C
MITTFMHARQENGFRLSKKMKIRGYAIITLGLVLLLWYAMCLPNPLFRDPVSTVIYSDNRQLLGAMISGDGQWRFPNSDSVTGKFENCILQFEDRYFYRHPGINPFSLFRAMVVNIRNGEKTIGGSTLTMQLIRISRKGKNRSYYQKLIEIIQASRAELRYTKKEILTLYASNAPFGGNVVGIEAASWRYFARASDQLSWAETATLAVLPNAPSLIFPGKNHVKLRMKRDKLLKRLFDAGIINNTTYTLSLLETIPSAPSDIPQIAPHLLTRVYNSALRGSITQTTINKDLQKQVTSIIEKHVNKLLFNGIGNAAALIANVESGEVLAYIGNAKGEGKSESGNDVDVITAPRSTGSILKPVLYAASLDDGLILPGTLIPDIPVMWAGYSPKNYSNTFDGAVHAQWALSRSLNIPAVFMLKDYNVDRFYSLLKECGMTTLNNPSGHYGLSLILGGAEGTLWDIAGIYTSMARTLNHFATNSGDYNTDDFRPLTWTASKPAENQKLVKKGNLSAASVWLTFKALLEVNRPEEEIGWESFLSSKQVAWKTGTSFGFRDGWAVGITPQFIVAVWVGNAAGEGRPGLTGTDCAAPILFDIFQYLPTVSWFDQPFDEMSRIAVCRNSGFRATALCTDIDTLWVQLTGLKTASCPYHQLVHLDKTGKYRVNSDCESTSNMQHIAWFILPPVEEWYYKRKNAFYKILPPLKSGCMNEQDINQMEFIYPKENAKVFIPVDIDNQKSRVIFEVAHRKTGVQIYWHLDGVYIGLTQDMHQMALSPAKGTHRLEIIDENGNTGSRNFIVE